MSRYDYRDPGTDPAYCNPLTPEPDEDTPREGESWAEFDDRRAVEYDVDRVLGSRLDAIDPAEYGVHAIIDALRTLEIELAKVSSLERAWQLRRMLQGLERQIADLSNTAAAKVDLFS